VLGILLQTASFGGIGLLPNSMREAYGLHWSKWDEAWLRRVGSLTRSLRRLPPDFIWIQPDALVAEVRLKVGFPAQSIG